MMAAQAPRRNAARFVLLEELEMDRLTFSRRILQTELGFNPSQLDFIFALPGRKSFEVIFATLLLYEQCLERFQIKKREAACFQKIELIPLAERELRTVTVMMYSERIKMEDISTWLSMHCSVTNAFQIKDEDGIKTGASKFHVRLRTNEKGELLHLPSIIQLGTIRGFVFYNGQPKECRKCGSLNHLAAQCESVFCKNCKNHGHLSKNCPVPMKCNLCGKDNHRFRDCPSAYVNKARQQPVMTWEEESNHPEATEVDENPFSNQHPSATNTKTDQGEDTISRDPPPLTPGEEDHGPSGRENVTRNGGNVISQEQEFNLEMNTPKSLAEFPLLGISTPVQKSQFFNGNLLLDGLGTLPASFPLLSDSSSSGDQMAEEVDPLSSTNASSEIYNQEDLSNWSSVSSNSTPFLDSNEMTTLSCTMHMNKQPLPNRTEIQDKKKKRKRLKSKPELS